jgi:hypothetical protein
LRDREELDASPQEKKISLCIWYAVNLTSLEAASADQERKCQTGIIHRSVELVARAGLRVDL